MKLTLDQYAELKTAQEQIQAAQVNLQRVSRLLGIELDKLYEVSIELKEVLQPPQDA